MVEQLSGADAETRKFLHDALRWLLLGIPSLGRQCHLRSLGLKLMYSAAHNAACCCCCKINRQWPFGGPRSEVCSEGVDEDPPPPPPPSPAKSPSIKNWSTLSKKMIIIETPTQIVHNQLPVSNVPHRRIAQCFKT